MVDHNSHKVSLLELSVGVSYASDLENVTKLLQDVVSNHEQSSNLKQPLVGISDFGDSSVNFELRVWVDSNNINIYSSLPESSQHQKGKHRQALP